MTAQELQASIEAIIYAADEPATLEQLATGAGADKNAVREVLERLIANGATEDRGIEIRKVANGYKMYTKPQHHEAVRRFIKSLRPPLRLTMPALETLAVIAYRGPVTGPEIQEIRGVNVSGVVKTLLEKRLIATAGRKAVMGRPIRYRSSKEFLIRFGLSDLDELPSLKEFEQLARAALGTDEGIAPIEPEIESPAEPEIELNVEPNIEPHMQSEIETEIGAEPDAESNAASLDAAEPTAESLPRSESPVTAETSVTF